MIRPSPVMFAGRQVGKATTETGAILVFRRLLAATTCRPHGAVHIRVPHGPQLEYRREWHLDAWNTASCGNPVAALAQSQATAANDHFETARRLRDQAAAGHSNETPVQAWAAVARQCAIASDAKWRELDGKAVHSFADNRWFRDLDRIWDAAKAQVETLAHLAA